MQSLLKETELKMKKAVDHLHEELKTLRTGRASRSILDSVRVDYYGTPTPLNQVANLSVADATMIVAQPWDPSQIGAIEKGILVANLGLNPSNDGNNITIPIPPLNQERTQELVRLLKKKIEDGKVAIRNVRRDGVESLRKMERDKAISQDQNRRAQEQLQKATDGHTKEADDVATVKEAEIMQV